MTIAKIIAALATVAALGTAAGASAAAFESNGKTVEVRYHDLDLSQPKGQRALNGRINRAAANVCAEYKMTAAIAKCQRQAAAHVRSNVELAIAKAQGAQRYADLGKEKPVGAGN
jgi:UrcA family protein